MERALLLKLPAPGVSVQDGLRVASGFGSQPGLRLTETRLSTILTPLQPTVLLLSPGETLPPGPGGMNGLLKAVTAAFPGCELTAAHEPALNNAPRSPGGKETAEGGGGDLGPWMDQQDHPKPNRGQWVHNSLGLQTEGAGVIAISQHKLCHLIDGGLFSPHGAKVPASMSANPEPEPPAFLQ